MRDLLEKYGFPLRAPAGDPPAGDPPAGAPAGDPPAGDPPGGTPPAGDPPAGDPPAATPGQQTPPADGLYKPEGLPDTMLGKSDKETIDNIAKALKGYRDKDGARVVPEDPAGYADFSKAEISDDLKPYVETLADDPVYKELSAWAKAEGKDVGEFQQVVLKAYEAAAKANLLSPLVDPAAEEAALVPDDLKSASAEQKAEAAKKRVDAAEDFVKLQITNNKLPKEVGEHAMLSLLDTADGVKFLEHYMQLAGGGGAQPGGHGSGAGASPDARREQLRAELKKPEMQASHPKFDKVKYEALQSEYKKLLG